MPALNMAEKVSTFLHLVKTSDKGGGIVENDNPFHTNRQDGEGNVTEVTTDLDAELSSTITVLPLSQTKLDGTPRDSVGVTLRDGAKDHQFVFDGTLSSVGGSPGRAQSIVKKICESLLNGVHCNVLFHGAGRSYKQDLVLGKGSTDGLLACVCEEMFARNAVSKEILHSEIACFAINNNTLHDFLLHPKERADMGHKDDSSQPIRLTMDSADLAKDMINIGITRRRLMELNHKSTHFVHKLWFSSRRNGVMTNSALTVVELCSDKKDHSVVQWESAASKLVALQKSDNNLKKSMKLKRRSSMVIPQHNVPTAEKSLLQKVAFTALGGNARTMIVAICRPTPSSCSQALESMQFAALMGSLKSAPSPNEGTTDKIIRELREHVVSLTHRLAIWQKAGTFSSVNNDINSMREANSSGSRLSSPRGSAKSSPNMGRKLKTRSLTPRSIDATKVRSPPGTLKDPPKEESVRLQRMIEEQDRIKMCFDQELERLKGEAASEREKKNKWAEEFEKRAFMADEATANAVADLETTVTRLRNELEKSKRQQLHTEFLLESAIAVSSDSPPNPYFVLYQLTQGNADKLNEYIQSKLVYMIASLAQNEVMWKIILDGLLHHIDEIYTQSKIKMIVAIVKNNMVDLSSQTLVVNLFLSTQGKELLLLKRLLDASSESMDITSVIYDILTDNAMRGKVLVHFADVVQHLKKTEELESHNCFLCDIDSAILDGFYDDEDSISGPSPVTGLVPVVKAYGAKLVCVAPRLRTGLSHVQAALIHGLPQGLCTSLDISVPCAMCDEWKTANNFERFALYIKVYPEHHFISLADNSAGNISQGMKVLFGSASEQPGHVRRAYIRDESGSGSKTSASVRERLTQFDVYMFDTYLDIAVHMFEKGEIKAYTLKMITENFLTELESNGYKESLAVIINKINMMLEANDIPLVNVPEFVKKEDLEARSTETEDPITQSTDVSTTLNKTVSLDPPHNPTPTPQPTIDTPEDKRLSPPRRSSVRLSVIL
eukprot:m.25015 g.25015  ORF g.25015 m.25015 type:complete len:1006 (+) comp7666_c0_seq1:183-3200(+)